MLILNYHRVGTPPPNARYKGMYVDPKILRWQIYLLKKRKMKFVTVTQGLKSGCSSNLVAVTFDDGYLDNFLEGMPVLRELGVPATVYMVTGSVGKTNIVWDEAGDKNPGDLMSWNHLKSLNDLGWEIGSHASEHVHLARRSRDDQKKIIEKSWSDFKENLGFYPQSFAYPYGSQNLDTLSVLEELQCQSAVTIDHSGSNTALTPPLLLYRQSAKGYSVRHYFKSLSLLWQA
ncbi:MAG: polysaccharide deacetylase family protein [Proteobacteria bacterium]|nr:polysaccharide deacetylase family protein [Pseudomonadota bacterium]